MDVVSAEPPNGGYVRSRLGLPVTLRDRFWPSLIFCGWQHRTVFGNCQCARIAIVPATRPHIRRHRGRVLIITRKASKTELSGPW